MEYDNQYQPQPLTLHYKESADDWGLVVPKGAMKQQMS